MELIITPVPVPTLFGGTEKCMLMTFHDQTPLRHPVRQRFFALGLYMVMLVFVIAAAPLVALGPRKISEYIPDSWDSVLRYGYFPLLVLGLVLERLVLTGGRPVAALPNLLGSLALYRCAKD